MEIVGTLAAPRLRCGYLHEGRTDNALAVVYFCEFADEQGGEDLSPVAADRDLNMSAFVELTTFSLQRRLNGTKIWADTKM